MLSKTHIDSAKGYVESYLARHGGDIDPVKRLARKQLARRDNPLQGGQFGAREPKGPGQEKNGQGRLDFGDWKPEKVKTGRKAPLVPGPPVSKGPAGRQGTLFNVRAGEVSVNSRAMPPPAPKPPPAGQGALDFGDWKPQTTKPVRSSAPSDSAGSGASGGRQQSLLNIRRGETAVNSRAMPPGRTATPSGQLDFGGWSPEKVKPAEKAPLVPAPPLSKGPGGRQLGMFRTDKDKNIVPTKAALSQAPRAKALAKPKKAQTTSPRLSVVFSNSPGDHGQLNAGQFGTK